MWSVRQELVMWNLRNVPSSSLQCIRKFEEYIPWILTWDIWSSYCKLHRRGANRKKKRACFRVWQLRAYFQISLWVWGSRADNNACHCQPQRAHKTNCGAAENRYLGWSEQFIWPMWFTPVHFLGKKSFTPVPLLLCANASFIIPIILQPQQK